MAHLWFYAILSVIFVSLISLVGISFLIIKKNNLDRLLLMLVSLSAGSLFGDAFLHLLPEAVEKQGFTLSISLSLLLGIIIFFMIEKIVHWRHCHIPTSEQHPHHLATMNLIGDGIHNLIDGLIIGAAYLASIPVGIATTIAVVLHEVPQEIGDYGILLYSGMSKIKALMFNFLSALLAIVGAIIALIFGTGSETFTNLIVPFAAGGFIYIAGADLIPELHKKCDSGENIWHLVTFVLGIGLMVLLKFI